MKQKLNQPLQKLYPSEPRAYKKVLDLMEEYARSRNLPVEDPTGVKFSIMTFYLWAASKCPIYGVVAKDLNFLDVGKLDALAPAEEFVKNM